jgi:hypothetical protein
MKVTRKLAAIGLSIALAVTSVSVPSGVSAQVKYDPLEEGNDGIRIDYSEVPEDNNISVGKNSSGQDQITARRNVCFQLNCTVDSGWTVKADEGSDVGSDDVTITQSGRVAIKPDAKSGFYTITANPSTENVEKVESATIRLKVDADGKAAKPDRVTLDKEAIEEQCDDIVVDGKEVKQVTVSDDGDSMTVYGTVTDLELSVNVEPSYLYEVEEKDLVSFTSKSNNYTIKNGNLLTTTTKTSEPVDLGCKVGAYADTVQNVEFDVEINNNPLTVSTVCEEKLESSVNDLYEISMNQRIHFDLDTNLSQCLPVKKISKVSWTVKQNDLQLEPVNPDDDDADYDIYNIIGIDTSTGIAKNIQVGKISIARDASSIDEEASVIVQTNTLKESELEAGYDVPDLELQATLTFDDSTTQKLRKFSVGINTTKNNKFNNISLDFPVRKICRKG